MATQSHMEQKAEQKPNQQPQRCEVSIGLENQATFASGDGPLLGYRESASGVPASSSDAFPSGNSALSSSTAGSTAATVAMFGTHEALRPFAAVCVEGTRGSDLQGSRSPHAELKSVMSETGGLATAGPPLKGTGQPRGPPKSQRNSRASPGQGIWVLEGPPEVLRPQSSEVSPSTSSGSQPGGSRHSRASTWSPTSRSGPALRSHASEPSPNGRRPGSAALPVPAVRKRACGPGPAIRRAERGRAPAPGRAERGRAVAPSRAERRRAPAPGRAERGRAPAPGPAERGRAPKPGSAERGRAPARGRAPRGRAPAPGPAERRRAPAPGQALRSRATSSGPASRSRASKPSSARQSRAGSTKRGPTRLSRHTLPGPADGNPPPPGFALESHVFNGSSSSSDSEVESVSSQHSWHAVRMRASSPSPPGRFFFPLPVQCDESSSSSSSSSSFPSSPSSSSSSSFSSSSPKVFGLSSISTPSPDSLRRALMPEFEAQNPPPGEQVEVESTPHPHTPPVL
uniref:EZH inhibitory protein n=1 Tax=Otolemur garnettii TaxID=30611 RepID=H0XSZ6_OTOGA